MSNAPSITVAPMNVQYTSGTTNSQFPGLQQQIMGGGYGFKAQDPYWSGTAASIRYGGISNTVNTANFKIVNADFKIGAQGITWSLEDMLALSKKARFMREGIEIAMPKRIWEIIELYMQDPDGYSDLQPHEFIDKVLSDGQKQADSTTAIDAVQI